VDAPSAWLLNQLADLSVRERHIVVVAQPSGDRRDGGTQRLQQVPGISELILPWPAESGAQGLVSLAFEEPCVVAPEIEVGSVRAIQTVPEGAVLSKSAPATRN